MTKPAHSSLEGTLEDTANAVRALGATALPVQVDLRDTAAASEAAKCAIRAFGGLDILVCNASYLHLSARPKPKHIRLAFEVNACATAAVMSACADALSASAGACVTISPPLDLARLSLLQHAPHYITSKWSMTLLAHALALQGIRSCSLWPRHAVSTAATRSIESRLPGAYTLGRRPDDFAEAALTLALSSRSAESLFDDEVVPYRTTAPLDAFSNDAFWEGDAFTKAVR